MTTKTKPNTPATKPQRETKSLIMARPELAAGPQNAAMPAEPAKPPLMSDPRHVTPVPHGEPYATWHRAGMADLVPLTILVPRNLVQMYRHALAWVPPEGVTRTIALSPDLGNLTVDLDCEGFQPEEGVEFHVGLPSDEDCVFQILDEAADEVLMAMDRPPARTGPDQASTGPIEPAGKEVL
jgi:hypothetical protein